MCTLEKINLFKSPNRPLEKSFLSLSWKLSNKENNGGNYSFCLWQEYLHYNQTFFIRERKKWKWEEIRHCSSFFQLRHLVLFLNLNFSIRFGITIILDSVSRSWLNNLKLNTVNPQLKTFPCPERCLHNYWNLPKKLSGKFSFPLLYKIEHKFFFLS